MRYHKFPLPPHCDGESNNQIVRDDILNFLGSKDELPILFSEGNIRDDPMPWRKTRKVLERILQEPLRSKVLVYPLDELYFHLQRELQRQEEDESIVTVSDRLNRDVFEYTTKGCQFHEAADSSSSCCLSKVRRAGYMIAKLCCDKSSLIEGRHYPEGIHYPIEKQ